MANSHHTQKLAEGAQVWNLWREQNPGLRPDLRHAQFGAGAKLYGVDLRDADLSSAHLPGADLQDADFEGAELALANLQGAKLNGTNLKGADLSFANLRDAVLFEADLSGARLHGTDLSNADLTDAKGLMFDETRILHARFSLRPSDKWSVLRRVYTGPNMILNLIAMFLFFAPLVAMSTGLWGLSLAQNRVVDALNQIDGVTITVRCDVPENRAIITTIQGKEIIVPCRSMPMWKLLLGFGGPYGMLMPVLTGVLILYQVARYLLTHQISLMRDAEERSGVSPPLKGRFAYPKLYRGHQLLSKVFWIAVAAFLFRTVEFLFLTNVIMQIGR